MAYSYSLGLPEKNNCRKQKSASWLWTVWPLWSRDRIKRNRNQERKKRESSAERQLYFFSWQWSVHQGNAYFSLWIRKPLQSWWNKREKTASAQKRALKTFAGCTDQRVYDRACKDLYCSWPGKDGNRARKRKEPSRQARIAKGQGCEARDRKSHEVQVLIPVRHFIIIMGPGVLSGIRWASVWIQPQPWRNT